MITLTKPSTFELRPYQQECLEAVESAYRDGIQRPLVSLPTGTGKTVIFAHLLCQRPGRALVLAHRDELIRQAADKLLLMSPGLEIGIVKANENQTDFPIVVGSVQTLSRSRRLEQLTSDFATVVVDEAHHATAPTYRKILRHVGSFDEGGPLTFGCTATPERADKVGLVAIWDKVVYSRTILEMILDGYLANLRAAQVSIKADFDELHTRHGDFVESELEGMLLDAGAPEHVAQAYREYASDRKGIIFTAGVSMAHEMAETFQEHGIVAEALDGGTPADERRAILQRLHTGETQVVTNCAVLTEGFDAPSISCIVIARPTKSKPLYIQMIGRGTRPYPGKEDCLILDVVGASSRHNIITSEDLFGLDLKGRSVIEAVEEEQEREAALESGTVIRAENGELVAVPVNLFRSRPLHWQRTGQGAWVLPLREGYLRVAPVEADRWAVQVTRAGELRPLREALPLTYALGVAEDYARKHGSEALLNPVAPWRSEPATEKQLYALRKRKFLVKPGLSKGEASDLIAMLM